MAREEDWGSRRPNTRSRRRKPYNDDYKEDYGRSRVRRNYTQDDDYHFDSRRYEGRGGSGQDYDYDYDPAEESSARGSRGSAEDLRGRREDYNERREERSRREDYDERRGDRARREDYDERRVNRARREDYDDRRASRTRREDYDDDRERSARRRERYDEDYDSRSRSQSRDPRRGAADPDRSRRGAERARRKKRGGGCLPAVILVVLLLVAAVGGVAYIASLWGKVDPADFRSADIQVNPDLPASIQQEMKNYRTFMIFGVDSRDNTTLQEGTLADSNIIVAMNKKTGKVKLLSIYRDTYVETTSGEHMKLTEVYNKYGAKEQLATINKNFDLNVKEYVTVNWKTVADTINLLGGIDIELSEGECDGINKYIDEVIKSTGIDSEHVDSYDGTQHLDGVQAVTYCRLRKGLGDDYKRTERQRTVVTKTLSKAKSAGIPQVLKVCNSVFPGLSSSFSLPEVLTLAGGMGRFDIEDSAGFPFDNTTQEGGRYYLYPVTLESNVKQLHEYLYANTDYEPSGTVQNLSQTVAEAAGN